LSTKINLAVEARGLPVELLLTPGQRHDIIAAPALIASQRGGWVIADRGYDAQWFVRFVRALDAKPIIPPRRTSPQRRYDREIYKERNLVERCINKLKRFRRIATRYDKTHGSYLAFVTVTAMLLWMT
jgi:transposase